MRIVRDTIAKTRYNQKRLHNVRCGDNERRELVIFDAFEDGDLEGFFMEPRRLVPLPRRKAASDRSEYFS